MWGWVIITIVGLALIEHLVSLFDDIGKDVVVFENDEWGFSFRIASIDDEEGIRAVYDNSKSSYSLGLYNTNINTGVFYVDEEESNEDKIVFSY